MVQLIAGAVLLVVFTAFILTIYIVQQKPEIDVGDELRAVMRDIQTSLAGFGFNFIS